MPEVSSIVVVTDEDNRLQVLALVRAAGAGEPFDALVFQAGLDTVGSVSIGRPGPGLWQANTGLAAAVNVDGRREVAAVGGDGAVWHVWQRQAGGPWSDWDSLDAPPEHDRQPGSPVLATNEDGRLELFTVAAGALWHRWQRQAGQGPWHDWHSLQHPPGSRLSLASPAVGRNHDGRLELFAVDLEGSVWHIWQTAPSSGWSQWQSLDSPGVPPSGPLGVALQEDGRLVLLMATTDGALWHRMQQKAGAGPWEAWDPLDTPPGGLRLGFGARTVGAHQDGRLVLATPFKPAPTPTTNAQEVWLVEQTSPNGPWAGRSLGHQPSDDLRSGPIGRIVRITSPALASDADGRLLLVFPIAGTSWLYRLHQDRPNGTVWREGITNANQREWA